MLSPTRRVILYLSSILWALPLVVFGAESKLQEMSITHQNLLLAVSSDEDAIRFYDKTMHATTRQQRTRTRARQNMNTSLKQSSSPELRKHIIPLVANLAASRVASTIQASLQQNGNSVIPHLPTGQLMAREWMLNQATSSSTTKMLAFHTHTADYFNSVAARTTRPERFDEFSRYVDQQYPILTGSEDSWIRLFEQGKLAAIAHRLTEYWEHLTPQNQSIPSTLKTEEVNIDRYTEYYVWTRLWPIMKTYLVALTVQTHSETIQEATRLFDKIQHWHDDHVLQQAQARICGKWHWTVHNHQNHGDHHMTIFLGGSPKQPSHQPQPAEMKIHGDTVYLYWKFPQGYQEDSLLLSNNDKRLEGTFTNTMGPYGSIMGKRMTKCKP